MDSTTKTHHVAVPSIEGMLSREPSIPSAPVQNFHQLRGSGSYPSMIRARTANRYKITKRTSDSMIITGHHHHHHHHGTSMSSNGTGGMVGTSTVISEGNLRSASSKKRKLLNNKKTVYSRASRRKSLENLGLLVRNRCGTAKLQWPSEKKDTDVFDLLPEGCMQVRQLIRLKSRGGTAAAIVSEEHGGSGDFYRRSRRGGGGGRRRRRGIEKYVKYCENEDDDNNETGEIKESLTNEAGRLQDRRSGCYSSSNSRTDWKSRRNISVIVRIRPKQSREMVDKSIVFRTDSKTIVFEPKEKTKDFYFQGVKQLTRNDFGRKRPNRNVSFQYDKVYGPEATNKVIFEEMLKNLTDHLIEGYNSTVFAYGATGSGKTFTMIGSNHNPGLTVLMVESLYKRLDEMAKDYDCEVVCSYLEVYNETIKDLLRPEKELSIREDGKKGIIISELKRCKTRNAQELLKLLRSGNMNRTQHSTDLNAESSRSHAVFEVKLCLKRKLDCQQKKKNGRRRQRYQELEENIKSDDDDCGGDGEEEDDDCDEGIDEEHDDEINKVEVIQSKLVMVDLAGSERGTAASTSTHGNFFSDGTRQREGASINKSLLALASCISALADGKCHVPYRNSKLTRLLKDSLNGLCTTVMIANISPSALTSEDTYNTLKYADRAKSIVGPVAKQKNVFMEDLIVEDCAKTQMVDLQVKNVQLQEQLEEEKLKRELILKELEELQRKNVEMKSEAEQVDRNVLQENFKTKGKRRKKCVMGCCEEGDVQQQGQANEMDFGLEEGEKCCFTGKNGAVCLTEDQLPAEIQQYIEVANERARIFSEYVESASQTRFSEWSTSCKKLKADMADLLGRLPVEDENYISFSKLKNEVNNSSGSLRNSRSAALSVNENDHHHKKYALKLKNLTEKLEFVRQNFSTKNHLFDDDIESATIYDGNSKSPSPKMVAITLDQFLEYKRLGSEQNGNERVDQFYQQFCQQINNQLMTSGMTLINALKIVKSVYLQLHQVEESTTAAGGTRFISPGLQEDYKELLQFVYGPGPPVAPPRTQEEMVTSVAQPMDYDYNNNNNINRNVNKDNLLQPLSSTPPPAPQIPPQSSNLGRKSSPIMDDLANMRKLVERPLLIQLTSLLREAEEEDDDDEDERIDMKTGTAVGLARQQPEEIETLDVSRNREQEKQSLNRSNSSFSRFITTTARKSLSTSYPIYEPPPVTRIRGEEESSREFQLPSRATCVKKEAADDEDEEETRYNDDDGDDNDHHYPHPRVVDNGNDDSTHFPTNGAFQVKTSLTADESSSKETLLSPEMCNSLPGITTTTNTSDNRSICDKLGNPVSRKNSTSFEIIFDRKEEKRGGGQEKKSKPSRNAVRVSEKSATQFAPTVTSALSKQKVSENHLNNGRESLNEDWATTTGSSSTVTTSSTSTSTSTESVMVTLSRGWNNKSDIDGRPESGSAQKKKSIGNKTRLVDQAFIKDYHLQQQHQYRRHHHHQQQTNGSDQEQEGNVRIGGSKKGQINGDQEEEIEREDPSSYVYELESPCIDVLAGTGGVASNKKGFGGNADATEAATRSVKTSSLKCNKTKLEKESGRGRVEANNNKVKTTTSTTAGHLRNLNPLLRRGHLIQQEQKEKKVFSGAAAEDKQDIGFSTTWNSSNNMFSKQHRHQSSSNAGSNKSTRGGVGGGKSLNLPAIGGRVITDTTPSEFQMSIQGHGKNQPPQLQKPEKILQYKVIPVKKSIALHPSKATTNLTRSEEKVGDVSSSQLLQKSRINTQQNHYKPQQQEKQQNQKDIMGEQQEMMTACSAAEDESEWEVGKNEKSTQRVSQHFLLSSARSTMSHQNKGPYYHTNSRTFTISRESLPTANMPVISCSLTDAFNNNNLKNCGTGKLSPNESVKTLYREQHRNGEVKANYYSSNEDDDEGDKMEHYHRDRAKEAVYQDNNGNYTEGSEEYNDNDDGGGTSCYSDDCN